MNIYVNTDEVHPGYNKNEYKLESGTVIRVYSKDTSLFSTETPVGWKELGSDKIILHFEGMCPRTLTNFLVRRSAKDAVGTGSELWNLLLSEIETQVRLDSILLSVAKDSDTRKHYLTKEESDFYHSLPSEILTLTSKEFTILKRIVTKLTTKMKLSNKEIGLMRSISSCRDPIDTCCRLVDVDDINLVSDKLDDCFQQDGNSYKRVFW